MTEQLFQISIKAVILNDAGEMLLQAHPREDGVVEIWDLPGGRMDPGETFLETLRRELREEISGGFVGTPTFVMPMISPLTMVTKDGDFGLAIMAYRVELPAGFTPVSGEAGSIIAWKRPVEAAELLKVKFPPEFCEYLAGL